MRCDGILPANHFFRAPVSRILLRAASHLASHALFRFLIRRLVQSPRNLSRMLKTLTLRERANCYALSRSPPPPLSLAPSTPSPSHRGREVNKSMTDDFIASVLSRAAHNSVAHSARGTEERTTTMHQFGFFDDDIACTGSETDGIPVSLRSLRARDETVPAFDGRESPHG